VQSSKPSHREVNKHVGVVPKTESAVVVVEQPCDMEVSDEDENFDVVYAR
jgi:hypothetical protein